MAEKPDRDREAIFRGGPVPPGEGGRAWDRPEQAGARRREAEPERESDWSDSSPGWLSSGERDRPHGEHYRDYDDGEWREGRGKGRYERGYGAGVSGTGILGSYWSGASPATYAGAGGLGSRRGRYSGRGPRGYRRPDNRIWEEVCEVLTRHPEIDASDVEVAVKDGEVTLKGNVADRRTRRMAEDAIADISGVHDVHNELKTRGTSLTGNESSRREIPIETRRS